MKIWIWFIMIFTLKFWSFCHEISWVFFIWRKPIKIFFSTRNKFYPPCQLMEFFHQKQILSTVSFDGILPPETNFIHCVIWWKYICIYTNEKFKFWLMRVTAIFAFTHFYSSYYQYLFLSYSPTSSKDHQRTDEKWVQKIDQYLIQTLTLSNLQSVVNTYWRHVV
jgi:hypothetical protein